MTKDEFVPLISKLKNVELGGLNAQFLLAPAHREKYNIEKVTSSFQRDPPKMASVLIVFFPDEYHKIRFILTKRADYQGHHANQMSFTGGKKTDKDKNLFETAIRETFEEINVVVKKSHYITHLTKIYIPPSHFLVQPYIVYIPKIPVFKTNYEVQSVIVPELEELLHPNIVNKEILGRDNTIIKSPGFILQNEFIWGATAMILSELRVLLLESKG